MFPHPESMTGQKELWRQAEWNSNPRSIINDCVTLGEVISLVKASVPSSIKPSVGYREDKMAMNNPDILLISTASGGID